MYERQERLHFNKKKEGGIPLLFITPKGTVSQRSLITFKTVSQQSGGETPKGHKNSFVEATYEAFEETGKPGATFQDPFDASFI